MSRKRKSPIINLLVIILLIAGFFAYKRYSFSNELADLSSFLKVTGNEIAIYLNDNLQNEEELNCKGLMENESVYLPLSYVKAKLNNRFYFAVDIKKILYCLPDEIKTAGVGDMHQVGNAPTVIFKEKEPYLLIDFVVDYSNIRYDQYLVEENKRVYIYTDWDKENIAYLKGKEAVRLQGGNKSHIITRLKKGEEVKILDVMTKWIKVKTNNGYIGYIRKRKIFRETESIPVSKYIEHSRLPNHMTKKPCVGFHQLYSNYSSTKLPDLVKNTAGMNVIAPTWYCIKNNEGDIRSIANDAYSLWCHAKGYEVWATLNNFDIEDVDEKALFSSTLIRRKMINKILREVNVNNLDGINLDIELVPTNAGEDYMEFVRELSIELTKINCKLSVDTYVPYSYNKHYNLKEFNDFCDYVIIMCYDEHYAGSTVAGSVSSINYVRDGINKSLVDVDKDKLIIGLPFYTRIWTTSVDGKVTSIANAAQVCENAAVTQGLSFSYDETTGQNYGSKITLDGDKVECWMEDDMSLTSKMDEIIKAGVAGTAAWKLTQERENSFRIISMNKDTKLK